MLITSSTSSGPTPRVLTAFVVAAFVCSLSSSTALRHAAAGNVRATAASGAAAAAAAFSDISRAVRRRREAPTIEREPDNAESRISLMPSNAAASTPAEVEKNYSVEGGLAGQLAQSSRRKRQPEFLSTDLRTDDADDDDEAVGDDSFELEDQASVR